MKKDPINGGILTKLTKYFNAKSKSMSFSFFSGTVSGASVVESLDASVVILDDTANSDHKMAVS